MRHGTFLSTSQAPQAQSIQTDTAGWEGSAFNHRGVSGDPGSQDILYSKNRDLDIIL